MLICLNFARNADFSEKGLNMTILTWYFEEFLFLSSFGYYKIPSYAKSADLSKNGLKMSILDSCLEMTQKCSFRYHKSSN